jgi:glycosyltransferase involved in cell wall biosynthesis
MSILEPTDPAVLAAAVVDTLAVAADPQAREASIFYWERARSYTLAVVEAASKVEDPAVRDLAARLVADPADPGVYHKLRAHLTALGGAARTEATDALFERAWRAECNSRLGYHLGPDYGASGTKIGVDALRTRPPGERADDPGQAQVLVVIPFRDTGTETRRLRNLLACLLALRDQSAPRASYQVVVVETDEIPRWEQVVAPYADHYLFAPKSGTFNKSWAVNAGVVNAPGDAEVICVLDADVLADRDFIARNAARFRKPGTMGHLSYRDMWCLDEKATSRAIEERVWQGAPEAPRDQLRAFVLRRPPGCCVWVRTSAYHLIGGMDERFEGWGGEDNDFAYRMDTNSAFDSYDDVLLHMYHPSSSVLREDGELVNAHIPALSWRPDAEIGDLGRFAAGTGDHADLPHQRIPQVPAENRS